MNKLFLILVYLLLFSSLSAQEAKTYAVLSTNGLNMRNAPNLQAKVIAKLPYKAETTALSDEKILDTLPYCYNEMPVIGYWRKCVFQGKKGYLFDAYLWKRVAGQQFPELRDFVIFKKGDDCTFEWQYDAEKYWYGLYHTSKGAELRAVDVHIWKHFTSGSNTQWLGVSSDNDVDLEYIIGSKKVLPVGTIKGEFMNYIDLNSTNKAALNCLLANHQLARYGKRIFIERGQHSQEINELDRPDRLYFSGDIDGDGFTDYIFLEVVGSRNSTISLYLSSEAEQEVLAKMVAWELRSNCG